MSCIPHVPNETVAYLKKVFFPGPKNKGAFVNDMKQLRKKTSQMVLSHNDLKLAKVIFVFKCIL